MYLNPTKSDRSQIIYSNVDEIKLIPDISEVKKGDIKIKLKSRTLNTLRQFQPQHSEVVMRLHSVLLNMLFEEFLSVLKDDAVLPMIGNLHQYLPSICACKSPDCSKLATLSAPFTQKFQLNKYFIKSDDIRQAFLMNSSKVLDWVFRHSKMLNQEVDSIAVLTEAVNLIETSEEKRHLKSSLKIYILKWISLSFTDHEKFNEIKLATQLYSNKFIKVFTDTLLNSPLIEDSSFSGKSISLRQYLHFGNILQAAFSYITKNHKIRQNKVNCNCCICTSNISPEDVEFIFVKNFVMNTKRQDCKKSIKKLKNFLSSLNKDALVFYKKNSPELEVLATEIQNKSNKLCLGNV